MVKFSKIGKVVGTTWAGYDGVGVHKTVLVSLEKGKSVLQCSCATAFKFVYILLGGATTEC